MSHELFVIDRKLKLDEQEQSRVSYLRDKLSTVENLGLTAQAISLRADIATIERGCLITTPPLTDTELAIWRAWLPTAYTDLPDEQHHKLTDYHFDRIPGPVLKMWQRSKESGLFERFEIWTPENPRPDPILVGVNGNAWHLLARWGESDANLVSFDDIKCELVRRWYKNEEIGGEEFGERWRRTERTSGAMFMAMLSTIVSTVAIAGGFALLNLNRSNGGFLIAITFVGLVAIGTFIYVRRQLTRRCLASSTLMQAIAKDNPMQRELLPAST